MRKRRLKDLKPGQWFALFDNGPADSMKVEAAHLVSQDTTPGCYSIRRSDGLVQWQIPDLIVWTESQYEASKRFGECGGINWEWFYFPSQKQAAAFVEWLDANEVEHRGVYFPIQKVENPRETDSYFGVRCR